jgi:AcrR family transcriptional regulator
VASGATTASRRPRTKWGDREGRRRDILAAARDQIAAEGYLSLNMREIAKGAGVSAGTLYSYFATKEEIFATLYADEIAVHNERVRAIGERANDLEGLVRDLATAYLDLYAAYGRYFTTWSALVGEDAQAGAALPPALGRALREAALAQGEIIAEAVARVADADGLELRDPDMAPLLLWTVFNGLGDHVTSGRHHLTPFSTDELIGATARTLAAGLVTSPSR